MEHKKITFFELEEYENKHNRNHAQETHMLMESLKSKGWESEIIFFSVSRKEEIFNFVSSNSAYFSRIPIQNLSRLSKESYLELLRGLCEAGVVGFPTPDEIIQFESKDSLLKLISNGLLAEDSYGYGNKEGFKESFPYSLAKGERVLKPSFGKGGIWRVAPLSANDSKMVLLEDKIRIISAHQHQIREVRLKDFLEGYATYIDDGGVILDVPFLPFIKEGIITLFMLYDSPFEVLCKIPALDIPYAFGTSLFLGAQYRYEDLEKYAALISWFKAKVPELCMKLSNNNIPPLWSADFIPCQKGYILNQLNITAVNFSARLDIVDSLANHIIRIIKNQKS